MKLWFRNHRGQHAQTIARFTVISIHNALSTPGCCVMSRRSSSRYRTPVFDHDEEARLNFENKLLILDTLKDAEIIQSLVSHPMLGTEVLKNTLG